MRKLVKHYKPSNTDITLFPSWRTRIRHLLNNGDNPCIKEIAGQARDDDPSLGMTLAEKFSQKSTMEIKKNL